MLVKKIMLIVFLFFSVQSTFSQKYNFEVISDLFGFNSPNYWREKGNIVITSTSISIITNVKGKKEEEKFIITGSEGANVYAIKNVNNSSERESGLVTLEINKGKVLNFNYECTIHISFDEMNNSFTYYCIRAKK